MALMAGRVVGHSANARRDTEHWLLTDYGLCLCGVRLVEFERMPEGGDLGQDATACPFCVLLSIGINRRKDESNE